MSRASIAGAVALVVVSILIGGPIGGVAAIAGLAIAAWWGYRAVAAGALLALGVAAVLTVIEAPTTGEAADYLFDFAIDRPLAAQAGRIAGVLAVVAVVLAAVRERAPTSDVAATQGEQEPPDA
jgi:hypothetical protein